MGLVPLFLHEPHSLSTLAPLPGIDPRPQPLLKSPHQPKTDPPYRQMWKSVKSQNQTVHLFWDTICSGWVLTTPIYGRNVTNPSGARALPNGGRWHSWDGSRSGGRGDRRFISSPERGEQQCAHHTRPAGLASALAVFLIRWRPRAVTARGAHFEVRFIRPRIPAAFFRQRPS